MSLTVFWLNFLTNSYEIYFIKYSNLFFFIKIEPLFYVFVCVYACVRSSLPSYILISIDKLELKHRVVKFKRTTILASSGTSRTTIGTRRSAGHTILMNKFTTLLMYGQRTFRALQRLTMYTPYNTMTTITFGDFCQHLLF